MDQDDARDEAITEARVSGTSTRALAKLHGCSNSEIEAAIDRRLSYELDNRQRVRQVKLSVTRIEQLMQSFFERATKDKDVPSGILCCKLEERLAFLLGLDHPTQARVDVYAVERERQPSSHEKITAAIMRVAERVPLAQREAVNLISKIGPEKALALLKAGNGAGEIEGNGSAKNPTEGNGSSGPRKDAI